MGFYYRRIESEYSTDLQINMNSIIFHNIYSHSLSELPECQVPLAMETDVIEQILAIALHPAYDCYTAKVSVETILNLTQCPETHAHILRKEYLEIVLEICEQRHRMISQPSAQTLQGRKEDPMVINALKYVSVHVASPILFLFSLSFPFTNTMHARMHTRTMHMRMHTHTHTHPNK